MKKFLAFLLTFALLLVPFSTLSFAAEAYTDVTLSDTMAWASTVSDDGNNWHLYLNTSGYTGTAWTDKYEGLTYVYNDVEFATTEVVAGDNNQLYCTIPTSVLPADGGTITIKAGQLEPTANTTTGINITNEIEIAAVDGKLVAVDKVMDAHTVTIGGDSSNEAIYFTMLDVDGNAIVNGYEATDWDNMLSPADYDGSRLKEASWTDTESGVFVDGTTPIAYYDGAFKNIGAGTFYIGRLNATAGTTVTVKGRFISTDLSADWAILGTIYMKELTFTYDGSAWTVARTTEYSPISLASVWTDTTHVGVNEAGDTWAVYLYTNGYNGSDWNYKYKGFTYECGDATGTTTQVSSAGTNMVYFTIPVSDVPATSGQTITIKAGNYDIDNDKAHYGLKLTEDFDMIILDNELITPTVIEPSSVTIDADASNANTLYFALKDANGNTINTNNPSWDNWFSPANAEGSRYNAADWANTYTGVFVDGQPMNYVGWSLDSSVEFKNPGDTYYLTGLGATTGTTVTIRGYFAHNDASWNVIGNYYFKDITFTYDGSAWSFTEDIEYTYHTGTIDSTTDNGTGGFYFTTTETSFPYATDWSLKALPISEEQGGVYINGNWTEVFLKKYDTNNWYVCIVDAGLALANGDTVTISGDFIYGTDIITFADYEYTYTEVTVNKYTGTPVLTEDADYGSAAGFYFTSEDGAPYDDTWLTAATAADGDENGVFVNGTKTAITLKKIATNKWYVCISDAGITLNNDDVLTIKGDFNLGSDIVTFNATSFEYCGKHFSQGEVETTEFTIAGLDYPIISYDTNNSRWNMYFKVTADLPGNADGTFFAHLDYVINGQEYSQHWFKSGVQRDVNGVTTYDMYVPMNGLPATLDQEYVITLKAGGSQGYVNGTTTAIAYAARLTEDFTFTVGGDYTATAPTIDYATGNGGTENGIYLASNDALPTTGWDYVVTKVDDTDDGIFVDGAATDVVMKKYADGKYYVCLVDAGVTATEGTVVLLRGTFTSYNLNNVTFATAKYIYTDGAWETYSNVVEVDSTGVDGDANGDGKFNVFDIIRMKKFTLGDTDEINLTDADLNGDSKINSNDLAIAINLLLGLVKYESGANLTGIPTYTDDAEMRLAAYVSPTDDSGFSDYAAAGFTTLFSENVADYEDNSGNTMTLEAYMTLANKYDLDVLVESTQLIDMLVGNTNADATTINTMLTNLSKYNNFRGLFMTDEPTIDKLSYYKDVTGIIRGIDSDIDLFTSCLPTYTTDETAFSSDTSLSLAEKYSSYASSYGNLLGEFTYDFYPFKHSYSSILGITYNEKDYMRSDWFQNMTIAATAGKGAFDTGITVQTYANANSKDYYRDITEADVSFQVYSALAYGMKSINYFTYGTHWDSNVGTTSCMVYNGTKTDTYYAVQSVNNEIKAFDHVLLNFNWQGTIGITGDDSNGIMDYVEAYTSGRINTYSASNDAIIGCLRDSKGYDGFMLVNATDPSTSVTEEISVTFNNATRAIVYIDGVATDVELSGGTYSASLAPGQGIFVIPYIA